MAALRELGTGDRAATSGLLGVVAVVLLALSTSACNTMADLGEDVQAGGNAVSGAAQDVEDGTE
jgi:predicted small secreted protein